MNRILYVLVFVLILFYAGAAAPKGGPAHPKGKNATKTVKKPKTKNMELKMEMTKKPDKTRDLEGVWVRAPKFDANDGVRWMLM